MTSCATAERSQVDIKQQTKVAKLTTKTGKTTLEIIEAGSKQLELERDAIKQEELSPLSAKHPDSVPTRAVTPNAKKQVAQPPVRTLDDQRKALEKQTEQQKRQSSPQVRQQTARVASPIEQVAQVVPTKTQTLTRTRKATQATPIKVKGNLLTCDIPAQNICGEYTFNSRRELDSFERQCRSGGATINKNEHTCSSNVGYCQHTTNGRDVKTYAYGRNQATVARNCRSTGGTYIDN